MGYLSVDTDNAYVKDVFSSNWDDRVGACVLIDDVGIQHERIAQSLLA
jgi:hypothetical protein